MDMQMYNLVKDAMKAGKSAEDIVKEVNTLAQTAKEELEPKTPIADIYSRMLVGDIAWDGDVDKETLVSALACYFVQKGFVPDDCFGSSKEYRAQVTGVIDRALSSLMTAAKINKMEKDGVSGREMAETMSKAIWDMIADVFAG